MSKEKRLEVMGDSTGKMNVPAAAAGNLGVNLD